MKMMTSQKLMTSQNDNETLKLMTSQIDSDGLLP